MSYHAFSSVKNLVHLLIASIDEISDGKWNQIKEKSVKWKGLDRFGDVHEQVNWDKGKTGLHMHKSCYISLSSKRILAQAKKKENVRLKWTLMKLMIVELLASIPDFETAIGLEIYYHHKCYQDNVFNAQILDTGSAHHQPSMSFHDAQIIFFDFVRQAVLVDHEFRTLQSLLHEYVTLMSSIGHYSKVKSSYVKEILIKEFGDRIAFYKRPQRNLSDMVYDSQAAGTYVEAAILSLGITDEELIKILHIVSIRI